MNNYDKEYMPAGYSPVFSLQHPCTDNDNTKAGCLSYKNLKETIDMMKPYLDGDPLETNATWYIKDKSAEKDFIWYKPGDWTFTAGSVPVEPPKRKGNKMKNNLKRGIKCRVKNPGMDHWIKAKYIKINSWATITHYHTNEGDFQMLETEDPLHKDIELRLSELECSNKHITDGYAAARERGDGWVRRIKQTESDVKALKADIDLLKYPMGRITDGWTVSEKVQGYVRNLYVYGNKQYRIQIESSNITGYRKQGDYVQIRWEEESEGKNIPFAEVAKVKAEMDRTHFNTFLLEGDKLIPLENCEVTIDCNFIEVKGETK